MPWLAGDTAADSLETLNNLSPCSEMAHVLRGIGALALPDGLEFVTIKSELYSVERLFKMHEPKYLQAITGQQR